MMDLTPADAAVIFRLAGSKSLDHLPVPRLNDDGQTEIVGWIEGVGKLDDQLSPYAWFSLAEEAAAANDPDQPIEVEMLPLYTLSGEVETLELDRDSHFEWSIDALPTDYLMHVDELLDAGVPARFLLLAEAGAEACVQHVIESCPDLAECESALMMGALNACLTGLCENIGIDLDEELLQSDDDAESLPDDYDVFEAELESGLELAVETMQALDDELQALTLNVTDLVAPH